MEWLGVRWVRARKAGTRVAWGKWRCSPYHQTERGKKDPSAAVRAGIGTHSPHLHILAAVQRAPAERFHCDVTEDLVLGPRAHLHLGRGALALAEALAALAVALVVRVVQHNLLGLHLLPIALVHVVDKKLLL